MVSALIIGEDLQRFGCDWRVVLVLAASRCIFIFCLVNLFLFIFVLQIQYHNMALKETNSNPHSLLTKEVLEAGVKLDLGPEWSLVNYEIKDFTKKGDNYSCAVTSISCEVESNGTKEQISYVAKLNPLHKYTMMDDFLHEMFTRESPFLLEVSKKLNRILKDKNIPPIRFPHSFYSDLTKKKEMLLSRDLRIEGFKMFDRRIGMGFDHAVLVVKELAKLHAASLIHHKELEKDLLDVYPFMRDLWLDDGSTGKELFGGIILNAFDSTLKVIEKINGYERQSMWIRDMKDKAVDMYSEQLKNSTPKMKVICHGDCWNNNILFRHNDLGHPVEVALVDLQVCRVGSLGLDLNYFFYTSLTGQIRKMHYDQLLSAYFQEFENVMKTFNMEMPFTKAQLLEEMMNKIIFGIMSGIMILPAVVAESDEIPDVDSLKDNDFGDFLNEFNEFIINTADKNPIFKSRFLAIFDELLEKVIDSK